MNSTPFKSVEWSVAESYAVVETTDIANFDISAHLQGAVALEKVLTGTGNPRYSGFALTEAHGNVLVKAFSKVVDGQTAMAYASKFGLPLPDKRVDQVDRIKLDDLLGLAAYIRRLSSLLDVYREGSWHKSTESVKAFEYVMEQVSQMSFEDLKRSSPADAGRFMDQAEMLLKNGQYLQTIAGKKLLRVNLQQSGLKCWQAGIPTFYLFPVLPSAKRNAEIERFLVLETISSMLGNMITGIEIKPQVVAEDGDYRFYPEIVVTNPWSLMGLTLLKKAAGKLRVSFCDYCNGLMVGRNSGAKAHPNCKQAKYRANKRNSQGS